MGDDHDLEKIKNQFSTHRADGAETGAGVVDDLAGALAEDFAAAGEAISEVRKKVLTKIKKPHKRLTMTRGGKRDGAGRPAGRNKVMVTLRLPIWLARWLRDEARRRRYSQARIIEDALVAHHKIGGGDETEKNR